MKSETRANYIFLIVFMLLMGPGLFILSKKAYKKGAAGMNPPAPQTVSAYNNPNPQNPILPRMVPPGVSGFVDSIAERLLTLQPWLQRHPRSLSANPIMSEKLSLEYLGAGSHDGTYSIALIAWKRDFAPLPSLYRLTAKRGETEIGASLTGYEQQNLPIELRSELQQYGYVLPPDTVIWMLIDIPGSKPIDSLKLEFTMDKKSFSDQITLPAATSRPSDR